MMKSDHSSFKVDTETHDQSRAPIAPLSAVDFWEGHYRSQLQMPSGQPSAALVEYVGKLPPGKSLDLGCARGDDVLWLAHNGWNALGVDVSETAIANAIARAAAADLSGRARFERHDLPTTFPDGTFDLVTAMYLQSPAPFERIKTLRIAADRVAHGGLLLTVVHGSRPPWSWADPEPVYPTANDEYASLSLDAAAWQPLYCGPVTRLARGPQNQQADVIDMVVAVQRLI
jgi:SAM-dependent methyltransferase